MTVPEKTRDAVLAETQERCGLVSTNMGRCARDMGAEIHHIRYRSHGGGDEATNLLPVCHRHHSMIHENRLRGPYEHKELGTVYVEGQGEGKRYWQLWPLVKGQWEEAALIWHERVVKRLGSVQKSTWEMADALCEMSRGNLWTVLGYDTLTDYAIACHCSGEWFERLILAEKRRRELPEDIKPRAEHEGGLRLMLRAGKAVSTLASERPEKAHEVFALLEGGAPASEAIRAAREAAGAISEPEPKWEVSAKVEGMAHITVTARDGEAAGEKAARYLRGYKPFRDENPTVEITVREVKRA